MATQVISNSLYFTNTTNNYSWRKYHWENLKTWGWSWNTPLYHKDRENYIRKITEAATFWLHCPSPKPVQHCTERALLNLSVTHWEKKVHGLTPSSPVFEVISWDPLPWSCTTGVVGKFMGLNYWKSGCDGEGWRNNNNQHSDTSTTTSYLLCPSKSPNHKVCSSGEIKWWCSLTKELTGWGSCLPDWGPERIAFLDLEACHSTSKEGSWVIAWESSECSSRPHMTRKPGCNTLKLCSPATFKQRVW